jgi:feruloyl-CoA synthase
MILANGGTLYIDGGKPTPAASDVTLAKLREIRSTIYFNVPRGFDMLVAHLESDETLAEAALAAGVAVCDRCATRDR